MAVGPVDQSCGTGPVHWNKVLQLYDDIDGNDIIMCRDCSFPDIVQLRDSQNSRVMWDSQNSRVIYARLFFDCNRIPGDGDFITRAPGFSHLFLTISRTESKT